MRTVAALFCVALVAFAPPARPHYTDIAPQSAISYRSNNDFRGRKYFPQPMCGGVAVLDFDGDGLLDLFFTNGAKLPELKKTGPSFHNYLLRQARPNVFEDVTAKAGVAGEDLDFSFGAAAGDFDNDGFPDLFVANAGRNALYRNRGDGTFADVTAQSGIGTKASGILSVQGAWLDYDNDGHLDLVVSNYTKWTPELDRRCQRGDAEMYCTPRTYASVPNQLFRNLGDGKFQDVSVASGLAKVPGKGMGIAIADVNGDGWIDIFIANDTERNLLFLNQGNGTFQESALLQGVAYKDSGTAVSAMGADAKDYNNDGWPDIFYNDLMGQIWGLFRNERGRYFQYVSPSTQLIQLSNPWSGWSAGFIDYNNDGWKDIYSANGDVDNLVANAAQADTMFENVEGKTFRDVSAGMGRDFQRVGFQRGAAFADLNNDGFLDIIVTSLHQRPRLLINSADNGANWLIVELRGTTSNRDAIGARLKLTTPSGRSLYNHVTTSVGFLSSSDRRVHFGLGSESTGLSLEVRWPSGKVQVLHDLRAGQIKKLTEFR